MGNYSKMDESQKVAFLNDKFQALRTSLDRFYNETYDFELKFQKRAVNREMMQTISQANTSIERDISFAEKSNYDYNIIRMNCLAAQSQITSSKPKPTFTTQDADYETARISEKLDKYVQKYFKKNEVYQKCVKAFLHACIMRNGFIKILKDGVVVKHPRNMVFDNPYKGNHPMKLAGDFDYCSPHALIKKFPKKEKIIREQYLPDEDIPEWDKDEVPGEKDVTYCEIFDVNNKKHVIFTEDIILYEGMWPHEFVPYQMFRWEKSTEGNVQYGISDELNEMQDTIYDVIDMIVESYQTIGSPTIYKHKSCKVSDAQITNRIANIVEYTGEAGPPQTDTPPFLHPQYFEFLYVGLLEKSFFVCGNNMNNISGDLPKELNQASGIALQNYSDMDSKKFAEVRTHYEDCVLSLAKKIIMIGGKKKLNFDTDLKDIKIEEELEKIDIKAGNIMPDTISGQLQTAQFLLEGGILPPEDVLSMMKHPDIQKKISSVTTRVEAVDLSIERAIKNGDKPILYKELGVEIFLDRARKQFAMLLKKEGDDYPGLVPLSEFIAETSAQMTQDENIAKQRLVGA